MGKGRALGFGIRKITTVPLGGRRPQTRISPISVNAISAPPASVLTQQGRQQGGVSSS